MARRTRRLGSTFDADELEKALEEVKDLKPKPQPICTVRAGADVRWAGILTDAQCARFQRGRELGQGAFATAYEDFTDSGRVVKFTGDAREASVAAKLKGKRLRGSVNIFDIAKLRGQVAVVPIPNADFSAFKEKVRQPIFALITERVEAPSDVTERAAGAVWRQLKPQRPYIANEAPARFRVNDWVDTEMAVDQCEKYAPAKEKAQCRVKVEQVTDAIDEQAANGVIPLDLHAGNWGERANGDPVILDFGVSAAPGPKPRIALAKAPKAPRCPKGPKGKACRVRLRRK
jgi:hypothetical protein